MTTVTVSAAINHARQEIGSLRRHQDGWCYTEPVWGTDSRRMTDCTWFESARHSRKCAIFRSAIEWIIENIESDWYPDRYKYEHYVQSGWDVRRALKTYLAEISEHKMTYRIRVRVNEDGTLVLVNRRQDKVRRGEVVL